MKNLNILKKFLKSLLYLKKKTSSMSIADILIENFYVIEYGQGTFNVL